MEKTPVSLTDKIIIGFRTTAEMDDEMNQLIKKYNFVNKSEFMRYCIRETSKNLKNDG